jgi:two-component system sensor histidine kinase AlgZ
MAESATAPWLPDLCRLPRIAACLGVAELVVVVIALAPRESGQWSFAEFVAASLFALWIALVVSVALCKARPWIDKLPRWIGIAAALSLPMAAAGLGALCVHQIDVGLQTHLSVPSDEAARFVSSASLLTGLITAIALRYFYMREQWQAQLQAQAKAQVDALQARIRPHFLFNSMNTIASLVRTDPRTAERAVEDLSELFRAALGAQGESTLAEEIHLAHRYLAIETLRLGDRLQVEWDVAPDAPMDLRLPRLVLQPLLENAVVHGIAQLAAGGRIRIAIARVAPRRLCIEIANPAPPVGSHAAAVAGGGGNRHAQESIAQRLAYHFGTGVQLSRSVADGEYRCRIELPLP